MLHESSKFIEHLDENQNRLVLRNFFLLFFLGFERSREIEGFMCS